MAWIRWYDWKICLVKCERVQCMTRHNQFKINFMHMHLSSAHTIQHRTRERMMRALFQLSDTQDSIYFNLFACAWFKSILQHLVFGSVRVFCLFDCQPYIFWLKIYWCCISFFVNFKVFFVVLPAWLDLKDWFFFPSQTKWMTMILHTVWCYPHWITNMYSTFCFLFLLIGVFNLREYEELVLFCFVYSPCFNSYTLFGLCTGIDRTISEYNMLL